MPFGVVLAGGESRRLGEPKSLVELCGRRLIEYPLAALIEALGAAAVVAKPDTSLASLGLKERGVDVWHDETAERHPLAGVVAALRRSECERVLFCACDLPFVTAGDVTRLAATAPAAGATVALAAGIVQPQFAVYSRACLGPLGNALERSAAFTEAAQELEPHLVEFDAEVLFNVNAPADLAEAERRLVEADR